MRDGGTDDLHVKGQSVPCPNCDDGFIVHGTRTCCNCGHEIEAVEAYDEASDWDQLEKKVFGE